MKPLHKVLQTASEASFKAGSTFPAAQGGIRLAESCLTE